MEVVKGGELHEEVVGVLAVGDGLTEGGLALLEEERVLLGGDGGGLEREHGAEGELAGAEAALGHGHEPVGGEELVAAAGAGLLDVGEEGVGCGT